MGPADVRPAGRTAACAILAFSLAVGVAVTARAQAPRVILDRPRAGEFQPVRGSGWLVWQENTLRRPRHYDLFARRVDGGERIRVNPPGTNGANGDVDEGILVYQRFDRRRSGIRFYDLGTRDLSTPPPGVNTRHWEYWPSMSGKWLLFGRLLRDDTYRILLFDLSTGNVRRLATIRGKDRFLAPGQVNGGWAVWHRCRSRSECNVIRYRIRSRDRTVLANPGGRQHSPSVTRDGTVYFVRGQAACGSRVRLMRKPFGGRARELWRLPNGDDVGRTHAQARRRGTTILYDHFSCGEPTGSDAWELRV